MPRWHVQIVNLRARDVRVGDVVAKDPDRADGWFRVNEVKNLPDGSVNVIDKGNNRSFTAGPFDLVGLQTPVQLPPEADRSAGGAPAATAPPATPPATPPEAAPEPSTARTPEGAAREAAARAQSGGESRALPSP
ncbi:MAG: hypothetical protein ACXIVQ_12805 [Acidimicrobiales bacterium]